MTAIRSLRRALVALCLALLLPPGPASAQEARPSEGIDVTIGLAGLSRVGESRPVTIEVVAGPRGLDEDVVLQQDGLQHVIPVSAAAHGRRRLRLRVPSSAWGETWSVGGRELAVPANATVGPAGEVGIEITRDAASVLQALGRFEAVATLAPAEAPTDPEDWRVARLVLVDADAAPELDDLQWRALRDHVLAGATLLVHGAQLDSIPEELHATASPRAGSIDAAGVTLPVSWLRSGRSQRTPDLTLLEDPGLVTNRRFGLGTLVTVGYDLQAALDAGELDHDELNGSRLLGAPTGPAWAGLPHASRIGRDLVRRDLVLGVGLGVALLVLVIARIVAARRFKKNAKGDATDRRRDWRLAGLGAGLGLVLFLIGGGPRPDGSDSSELVLEEYFPEAERRRVTRFTPLPERDGRISLPNANGSLASAWVFDSTIGQNLRARGRVELSTTPSAVGLRGEVFTKLWWRTVTWEDADEIPLRLVEQPDGTRGLAGRAAELPGLALRLGQVEPKDAVLRPAPRPRSDLPPVLRPPSERRAVARLLLGMPDDVAIATDAMGVAGTRRYVVVHRPQTALEDGP